MIPPCTPTPDHAGQCPRGGAAEDAHDDSEEGGLDLMISLAVALVRISVRSRKGRPSSLAGDNTIVVAGRQPSGRRGGTAAGVREYVDECPNALSWEGGLLPGGIRRRRWTA